MPSLPVPVGFGRANMRPDSGRRLPLVYMCVLVHQNRKIVIWGTQALELVSFFAFVIYLDSFYEIIHKCFNFVMLEGV